MKSKIAIVQAINHPHRRPTLLQRRQLPSQPVLLYSLSLKEFHQLLAAAGNDAIATELRQIATIIFYTGIRQGELRDLTWSDVDMEKHTICVGAKDGKRRTVPFGGKVLQVLVDRARASAGAQLVMGKYPKALLHRISRRLHSLSSTADEGKLTLYRLRRGFANRWLSAGGSLEGLRVVMGFSKGFPFTTFLSSDHRFAAAVRFQSALEDLEVI